VGTEYTTNLWESIILAILRTILQLTYLLLMSPMEVAVTSTITCHISDKRRRQQSIDNNQFLEWPKQLKLLQEPLF